MDSIRFNGYSYRITLMNVVNFAKHVITQQFAETPASYFIVWTE